MNLQEALQHAKDHPGVLVKPENQRDEEGAVYFYEGEYAKTYNDFDTGLFWAFPWDYPNPETSPFSAMSMAQIFGNWVVVDSEKFFDNF